MKPIEFLADLSGRLSKSTELEYMAQRLDDCIDQIQTDKLLLVYHRKDFGRNLFYPACDASRLIARDLVQCTSFTVEQVKALSDLGYTVKPVGDDALFESLIKGESK